MLVRGIDDMRRLKYTLLGLTVLSLMVGVTAVRLPTKAEGEVDFGLTKFDAHSQQTTLIEDLLRPSSRPVERKAMYEVSGQHNAAQPRAVYLNWVEDHLGRGANERLATALDSGGRSIPVSPASQSNGSTNQGAVATDRAALVALYNATDGGNWARNDNWLSGQPLGEWHGIVTNDEGRVSKISLAQNLLIGELTSEVTELTELTHLDLRRNELIGEIPDDLDDLINLDSLSLANNLLSGEIPAELGNLPNLESLSLESNQLRGDIPVELSGLSRLESLSIGDNQLRGDIPAAIGDLTNLRSLTLSGNQLGGDIPEELGSLTNLTHLDLRLNWLSGEIPAKVGSLVNLKHLNLGRNQLSGPIPTAIGDLSSLELLSLRANELDGQIPAEVGNLASLTHLDLSENQLDGQIPPELAKLDELINLYLSGNTFTGCIPVELQEVANNDLDETGLPACGLTVVMSVQATGIQIRIGSPIAVTATFSEPATGFTIGDVTVTSGTASNFAGSDGDTVYTFDVTPDAIDVVAVDIGSGAAEGSDGEGNSAAVQLKLGIPYDDDGDGVISRDEVINAIRDYLFGNLLTRDQVIDIIRLYLFG